MPTRSDPPRPPAAPRLESLTEQGSVGPSVIGDDALLAGQDLVSVAWDDHHSEFAELASCRVRSGSMSASHWYRTRWADVEITGADLATIVCEESGWHRVVLEGARLTGAVLSGCTLVDVELRHCLLDLASLRMATLSRVRFSECRMSGVDLTGATLDDVQLDGCVLTEAQLDQARCTRVALRRCTTTGLKGITGLAGATVSPVDLLELTGQLASALGIRVEL